MQDGFDGTAVDTNLWVEAIDRATAGIEDGHYFVRPEPGAESSWGAITTVSFYDIMDCAVVVELRQALNNDGDADTTFWITGASPSDHAGFAVWGGELHFGVTEGGVSQTEGSVGHAPASHRWLRLSERQGVLYFDTSADGYTWEEHFVAESPSFVPAAHVDLRAGTWAASLNPGEAQFDNVNLPPPLP